MLVLHARGAPQEREIRRDGMDETLRYDVAATVLTLAGLRVVGLDTGASARPSTAPWKRWTRNRAHRLLAVHELQANRLPHPGPPRVAV